MLQRKSEEDFQDGGKGGSGGEEKKGGGAATLKRRHKTSDTLTSTGLFQSPRLALVGGRNEKSVLTFASQMDHGQFPTNISPAARRPGALSAKVLSLSTVMPGVSRDASLCVCEATRLACCPRP